ncbi:MAG: SRPBCC family protein [Deltaproteobacteria bacterium]|nr:SRPBCC family protein [Deltaproteobacteria bacterium]
MWKKIAIVFAVVVVGFLGYAAMQPEDFAVQRSTDIKAPADRVAALIADFHAWEKWSPWEKMDPAMKRTFSGPSSGVGAVYEWSGNSEVGKGRMTVTAVDPAKSLHIKLEFIEPWTATNTTVFTFAQAGDVTKITWTMRGKNEGLMAKAMCVVMDMDKMVGGDFEKGLASLKSLAEKGG